MSSDDEPFAALAFKIATDPFVGKLCFFRVYSGTIECRRHGLQLQQRTTTSVSAVFCRCTRTTGRILKLSMQVISLRRSV